jgi:hypothetical protein
MPSFDPPTGYAVTTGPKKWVATTRFVNRLLRNGIRVLVVTESVSLEPGAFVVPNVPEMDPELLSVPAHTAIEEAARDAGVELRALGRDDAFIGRPLGLVRVGLYGGGGAPFNHAGILAAAGFPVVFLSDADVRAGALSSVDVFVMPGGGERAMFGQLDPLGEAGCRAIAEWVRAGGMYIGCCAGSYDCIVNSADFLAACPPQGCLQLVNAAPWRGEKAVGFLGLQSPGVGVVRVRNARPAHPVMYGMPDEFSIVHYNGPVLDPDIPRVVEGGSAALGLASFTGWTERFTPAERFAGQSESDEPTYLAQAIAAARFSIAAGELGRGRVVAFGSHPEFGFDLAMAEWGEPARMFVNAAFWQAASTSGAGRESFASSSNPIGFPPGYSLVEVHAAVEALQAVVHELAARPIDPAPNWLAPAYAMSVFGMPPDAIWRQALDDLVALSSAVSAIAGELHQLIAGVDRTPADRLPWRQLMRLIDAWVLDERPPEWGQDGGYQGVRALLRTATRMCARALAQWDASLGPPAGPYDYFAENPYHQVAGSYLSASGCVAGAVQLMRGLRAEWEMTKGLTDDRVPIALGHGRASNL